MEQHFMPFSFLCRFVAAQVAALDTTARFRAKTTDRAAMRRVQSGTNTIDFEMSFFLSRADSKDCALTLATHDSTESRFLLFIGK